MSSEEDYKSYVMVAAIDFGTTYSGYAFSFKHEPDSVKMNKNWGARLGVQSYKTPTCVLTNPQVSVCSYRLYVQSNGSIFNISR